MDINGSRPKVSKNHTFWKLLRRRELSKYCAQNQVASAQTYSIMLACFPVFQAIGSQEINGKVRN